VQGQSHHAATPIPSATPATQNEGGCRQVPHLHLHRKVPRRAPKRATRATPVPYKYHACHAKRGRMPESATPAPQNENECHQGGRLPRETKVDVAKRRACHAKCRGQLTVTKRATRPSPAPEAPRLPRQPKVHVAKCARETMDVAKEHACHAKCRGKTGD